MAALVALIFCASFPSTRVFADGGAPNLAYVAGTSSGVGVIDVGQGRVARRMGVAGDPRMILLSPDGRFLYVTQPMLGRVAVIEAKTGQVVCFAMLAGRPSVLALSLNAMVLYAGGDGANVSAVDPGTCRVLQSYKTGGPIYGLAVTALGSMGSSSNQLWVTEAGSLAVFDARGPLIDSVAIADGPQFLTIPNGFTAYVTTRRGTVLAVDLGSRRVSGALLAGGTFGAMDYDALTGEVYVPDEKHNMLEVLTPIDPGITGLLRLPKEPNRVIHTGVPPQAVAITNDGLLGFVALRGGSVAMLDLIGRHMVYAVAVGGDPHFIITGLYPPNFVATAAKTRAKVSSHQQSIQGVAVFALAMVVVLCLVFLVVYVRRRRGRGSSF